MEELIKIQSTLKAPKGQYNSFGKYKYRSAEDILEAVKPLLLEHSCMLTIKDDIEVFGTPVVVNNPGGSQMLMGQRIYVKATATLTNKDGKQVSSTAYAREEDAKKGMDGSQVTGAASSYARKYALNGLFAIDDAKDSDATDTHGKDVSTDISSQAIKEVKACKTKAEVQAVWNKYFNSNKEICVRDTAFYTAVVEQGTKIS